MSEIEGIRKRLEGNLTELEQRLPPLVRKGRDVVRLVGGGVGGSVALFVARKAWARAKRVPQKKAAAAVAAAPTVIVRSGIGLPAVVAVAAIWAAVRVYEIKSRAESSSSETRAELRPLPGRKQA